MTALLAFLRLAWPYIVCALASSYLTHRVDSASYESLQAEYKGYQVQVAQADDKAQQAAKDALQAQIQTRLTTEANNGKVIAQLQAERDSAAADRDFARRLLAAAQARPAAPSHPVPATAGGPAASQPTQPSGDRSLATDLGDAAGECRDAIQRLAALQVELAPQVKP